MLKAVLDTNLIISAAITPQGQVSQILTAWRNGLFELITSPQIIEEMRWVLFSKKIMKKRSLSRRRINDLLTEIRKTSGLVKPKITIKAVKDDPDDDKFIEVAVTAKADCIVSGDKHLKDLKSYQGIKILSAAEFMVILGL
jgi:hypothetical protein